MKVNSNKTSDYTKNQYDNRKLYHEIFIIKCNIELSLITQKILYSCSNKQFYQVLETIEYGLKENLHERDHLLQIFYSIAIALQNNTNASFFDIRIDNIMIKKIHNLNKINLQPIETNYLKINSSCIIKLAKKKKEASW